VNRPTLAEREAAHLERLRALTRREAELDGALPRPPWGSLVRDTEAGRREIARRLARLEHITRAEP
jgi:hypothetical protein